MTTKDKIARRKLSLLELASEMNNVSKACRIMGYSRQQFYEIRRNYQTYGADGLIDRLPGARVRTPTVSRRRSRRRFWRTRWTIVSGGHLPYFRSRWLECWFSP